MNSKGHLYMSIIKSLIRVIGGWASIVCGDFRILAGGIIIAELFGILEELFDKRG